MNPQKEKSLSVMQMFARYGLGPLHPAVCDIVSLSERVAELEKELNRPFIVERGPWAVSNDGRLLYSDDFTHDVALAVSGNFGDDQDRRVYAEEIARRLNSFGK